MQYWSHHSLFHFIDTSCFPWDSFPPSNMTYFCINPWSILWDSNFIIILWLGYYVRVRVSSKGSLLNYASYIQVLHFKTWHGLCLHLFTIVSLQQNNTWNTVFEVMAVLAVKTSIFWDIIICNLVKVDRRFRGTYPFHLLVWRIS